MKTGNWNKLEISKKKDFKQSMARIEAWYSNEIIDRAPVRFQHHNAEFNNIKEAEKKWRTLKERWFDTEYQVESFIENISNKTFRAETFPIFWPNLGPDVFQAFCGQELEFGEVTSWTHPVINSIDDLGKIKLDYQSEYFCKIEELTRYALERGSNDYIVGYTDFHPGMDFVASWRGNDKVCMDFYLDPELLKALIEVSLRDFQEAYDHFHQILANANQPSVTWLGVPSAGKMHVPSNDFSNMIGNDLFDEYCLSILQQEVKSMDTNIFHLDGRGVAKHIDSILTVPEIDAIQWVQGAGDDQPILQWVPFIKKLQKSEMPVIVDLALNELEQFTQEVNPKGIFLSIGTSSEDEEETVLKKLLKWK